MSQRKGLTAHRYSELKKTSSCARVGLAIDKHQATTPLPMQALSQSRHWVWGPTHRRAMKEEIVVTIKYRFWYALLQKSFNPMLY